MTHQYASICLNEDRVIFTMTIVETPLQVGSLSSYAGWAVASAQSTTIKHHISAMNVPNSSSTTVYV